MKCMDSKCGQKTRYIEPMEDTFTRPYLNKNPHCEICLVKGHIIPAVKVVHIKPPCGDFNLFWDQKNWQSLCRDHYDEKVRMS